jgi:hypothetical protein
MGPMENGVSRNGPPKFSKCPAGDRDIFHWNVRTRSSSLALGPRCVPHIAGECRARDCLPIATSSSSYDRSVVHRYRLRVRNDQSAADPPKPSLHTRIIALERGKKRKPNMRHPTSRRALRLCPVFFGALPAALSSGASVAEPLSAAMNAPWPQQAPKSLLVPIACTSNQKAQCGRTNWLMRCRNEGVPDEKRGRCADDKRAACYAACGGE